MKLRILILTLLLTPCLVNAASNQASLFNYNDYNLDKILKTDFSLLFQSREKRTEYSNPPNSNVEKSFLGESLILPPTIEVRSQKKLLYAEGSGTRDGGSGIISLIDNSQQEQSKYQVQLLDVYRSENLDLFPTFISPNEDLLDISRSESNSEVASEKIFNIVVERIKVHFPHLADLLIEAHKNLPKEKWISVYEDIPLIDDFIGNVYLHDHQQHVQIAYRHTNIIFYNEKLYSLMDGFNRAALKLHEYLYALSSLKTSPKVQRLVSLFMGLSFTDEIDYFIARKTLKDLNLEYLSVSSNEIPQGARLSEEPPTSEELCGLVKKITLSQNSNSKITASSQTEGSHIPDNYTILEVEISYDPNHEQLQTSDFNSKKFLALANQLKEEFSKSPGLKDNSQIQELMNKLESRWKPKETKKLRFENPKEWIKYISAYNYGKNYIEKLFPIYLYPAQNTPSDIICINKKTSKVSSIEVSKSFHNKKNERDLNLAKVEASYFTIQGEYIRKYANHKNRALFRDLEAKTKFIASEIASQIADKDYIASPSKNELVEESKLMSQFASASLDLKKLILEAKFEDTTRSDLSLILDSEELGKLKIRFDEN